MPRQSFCPVYENGDGQPMDKNEGIRSGAAVCGRPSWTDASLYCEKHYHYFYPSSYRRIQEQPVTMPVDDPFAEDRKTHDRDRIKFAFWLAFELRDILGGPNNVLHAWAVSYKDNPLISEVYNEVEEAVKLKQFQKVHLGRPITSEPTMADKGF